MSDTLAALEGATADWQRQLDLDARLARTRADVPLLDAEAQRTQHPFAVSNAAAAREHLARLESERRALGDAVGRYEIAAAARERELVEGSGPASERLTTIAHESGRLHAALRELHEALTAGHAADSLLAQVREQLEMIWRLSSADSTLISNPLIDLDKYSRLGPANQLLLHVNAALATFGREVADTGVNASFPPLDLSGPVKAFDILNTLGVETYVSMRAGRAVTTVTHCCAAEPINAGGLPLRRPVCEDHTEDHPPRARRLPQCPSPLPTSIATCSTARRRGPSPTQPST